VVLAIGVGSSAVRRRGVGRDGVGRSAGLDIVWSVMLKGFFFFEDRSLLPLVDHVTI